MSAMNKTMTTFAEPSDAMPKRDGMPGLYYYPDAERLRTPFRDACIDFLYRAALEVDDGRLKYAYVYVYTPKIEDGPDTLDLTFVVDTKDWDIIAAWGREIIVRIIEWEAGLSDEQRKEFNRRVHFGYFPSAYVHAPA